MRKNFNHEKNLLGMAQFATIMSDRQYRNEEVKFVDEDELRMSVKKLGSFEKQRESGSDLMSIVVSAKNTQTLVQIKIEENDNKNFVVLCWSTNIERITKTTKRTQEGESDVKDVEAKSGLNFDGIVRLCASTCIKYNKNEGDEQISIPVVSKLRTKKPTDLRNWEISGIRHRHSRSKDWYKKDTINRLKSCLSNENFPSKEEFSEEQKKFLKKIKKLEEGIFNIEGCAGSGKTSLWLHLVCNEIYDAKQKIQVLIVCKADAFAKSIARGIIFRMIRKMQEDDFADPIKILKVVKDSLKCIHFCTKTHERPCKVKLRESENDKDDINFDGLRKGETVAEYKLLVVDEANPIVTAECGWWNQTLRIYFIPAKKRIVVSNRYVNENLTLQNYLIPQCKKEKRYSPEEQYCINIKLKVVFRTTKRLLIAAEMFFKNKKEERPTTEKENGEKLERVEFDEGNDAKVDIEKKYADETIKALKKRNSKIKKRNSKNIQYAILVNDQILGKKDNKFKEFKTLLEERRKDCVFTDAETNFSNFQAQISGVQYIVLDELSNQDGLEYDEVIAVGFDETVSNLVLRKNNEKIKQKLYRVITRAKTIIITVDKTNSNKATYFKLSQEVMGEFSKAIFEDSICRKRKKNGEEEAGADTFPEINNDFWERLLNLQHNLPIEIIKVGLNETIQYIKNKWSFLTEEKNKIHKKMNRVVPAD